ETGGPEVLRIVDRPALVPAAGEIVVRNRAIGLNFVDVYLRTGLYPSKLHVTPGTEGAGEVAAVGADVTDFAVGDRVLYSSGNGAYADETAIAASKAVPLPDDIAFDVAATLVT